ncbi:hypothetical protein BB561_002708 [Smittium simulii]|uniref:Uncharacterized protein n=1 Tax=Smittium simulii TaxID=133385 RepID=A0A2T9YPE4_9FUNG|nr:hypothetical protein BB561_002708 [Smittium simulii]
MADNSELENAIAQAIASAISNRSIDTGQVLALPEGTAATTLAAFSMKPPETIFKNTEKFYVYLLPCFIDPSFPQVIRRKLHNLKQTLLDAERIYLFIFGLENRYVDILNINNSTTFLDAIKLVSKH